MMASTPLDGFIPGPPSGGVVDKLQAARQLILKRMAELKSQILVLRSKLLANLVGGVGM